MAENKTTQTENSVSEFLNTVVDEVKRNDCLELVKLVTAETGMQAKMWGPAIVGFGKYHYKYESGHEGDAPLVGLSPRANAITMYLAPYFFNKSELLSHLGKHKVGKGCLYIKRLADVDSDVLRKLITESVEYMKDAYPDHQV